MEVIRGPLPVSVSLDDQWGMKTRFTAVTPKKAGVRSWAYSSVMAPFLSSSWKPKLSLWMSSRVMSRPRSFQGRDQWYFHRVIRLTNSVFFLGKSDLIPAGVPTTTKITVPERSPDYTRVEHTSTVLLAFWV